MKTRVPPQRTQLRWITFDQPAAVISSHEFNRNPPQIDEPDRRSPTNQHIQKPTQQTNQATNQASKPRPSNQGSLCSHVTSGTSAMTSHLTVPPKRVSLRQPLLSPRLPASTGSTEAPQPPGIQAGDGMCRY